MTEPPRAIPITIEPNRLCLHPGEQDRLDITLLNSTNEPDLVHLTINGVPREWLELRHQPIELAPMSLTTVPVRINTPRHSQKIAGDRVLLVRASSERSLSRRGFVSATWSIAPGASSMSSTTRVNASAGAARKGATRKRRSQTRRTWLSPRNRSFALALLTLALYLLGTNRGWYDSVRQSPPIDLSAGFAEVQVPGTTVTPSAAAGMSASTSTPGSHPTATAGEATATQPATGDIQLEVAGAASQPSPSSSPEVSPTATATAEPAQPSPSAAAPMEPAPVQPTTAPDPITPAPVPPTATPVAVAPAPTATGTPPATSTPVPTPTVDVATSEPPTAPANVVLSPSCVDDQPCVVTLVWTDTSTSESGFNVYGRPGQGSDQGSFQLLGAVPADATSFIHQPESGNSHGWCYHVVATNDQYGDSPPSVMQCFTTE